MKSNLKVLQKVNVEFDVPFNNCGSLAACLCKGTPSSKEFLGSRYFNCEERLHGYVYRFQYLQPGSLPFH